MTAEDQMTINSIKIQLRYNLSEWLGNDIPDEGDDDYEVWREKLTSIENIESISDVIEYLESQGMTMEDFLAADS